MPVVGLKGPPGLFFSRPPAVSQRRPPVLVPLDGFVPATPPPSGRPRNGDEDPTVVFLPTPGDPAGIVK